jgi:hypothetical protein
MIDQVRGMRRDQDDGERRAQVDVQIGQLPSENKDAEGDDASSADADYAGVWWFWQGEAVVDLQHNIKQ